MRATLALPASRVASQPQRLPLRAVARPPVRRVQPAVAAQQPQQRRRWRQVAAHANEKEPEGFEEQGR